MKIFDSSYLGDGRYLAPESLKRKAFPTPKWDRYSVGRVFLDVVTVTGNAVSRGAETTAELLVRA